MAKIARCKSCKGDARNSAEQSGQSISKPAESSSQDGDISNDVERLNEFKHLDKMLEEMQAHKSASGVGSRLYTFTETAR